MALLIDSDLNNLEDFIKSIGADLSPAQQDIIFGYLLNWEGYPTRLADICKKHGLSRSRFDSYEAEAVNVLRATLAKRNITKFADLPLPEPHYKSKNRYVNILGVGATIEEPTEVSLEDVKPEELATVTASAFVA